MNRFSKMLWGVLFIVVGVVWGLNSLGLTNINIFFDGWWTLFIIIPCFIGLFDGSREGKTGNIIGLIIGCSLLLATWDVIHFELIAQLIFPFILVVIGLSFVFQEGIKGKVTEKVQGMRNNDLESIVATFSGQKIRKDDDEFKGANLDAVFGGIVLDLRKAQLEKETVIKASSIFGGIEILLPEDVNVEVKSTPIFGGVSNKIINHKEYKKTIYIDAFCMFGGVDIK